MFSGVFRNGNKTSKKPVTITREKSTTSKSDNTECIQHLRNTKNKLNNFNKTLLSIRSTVNTLLEDSKTIEQLVESRRNLHLQITELYNDMQLEETLIATLLPESSKAGRRHKSNRRRTKHNRRY